jgi:HAD superfamily hydrolase (TIGR01509 family)
MSDSLTRASGIVFDLDGTLVDSTYVHTLCWWEALQQFGHARPMAAVHHTVGMGSDHLLHHLLGEGRDRSQDSDIASAHDILFGTWHERLHPLPAARALLNWCRDAGLTVGLASSGGERDLWAMMEVLDHPDFDVIVTGDDVHSTKPAPDVIGAALDRAGLDPEDVMVVGDSVWDMAAATRIGSVAIGVATGGTSAPELESAGAELTFQDLAALLDALQDARPDHARGTWGARP